MIKQLLGFRAYAYVAVIGAVAGFAYGWHVESVRFAEFRGGVDAVGQAQEKLSRERDERNHKVRKAEDDKLKARIAKLSTDNRTLLASMRAHARRSLLPPAAEPSDGGGDSQRICFDRHKLNAGFSTSLEQFVGESQKILQRGDVGLEALASCVASFNAQSQ